MWRGERQAFDVLRSKVDPQAHYIWFHAASLGEFEQGRPLIEFIRRRFPAYRILLTFFSPSGYEVRKDYQGADIICYLPIDTISNARRFLRLVRPEIAFFIKYEFWYNYLHILKHRNIPTYSVSSIFREGQVFFKWYGRSYAKVLNCFTRFFVQNEQSRLLLARIGITDVDVVGDTRFDRVLQIKQTAPELPIVEAFRQNHPVFVAGSSWPPDEDIFIRFFNEHRDWRLIIAPHVIAEDHLQQILSKLNRKAVRYTCTTPGDAREADCLLIDCFGLLSGIYRYGDVATSEAVLAWGSIMFSKRPYGEYPSFSVRTIGDFKKRKACLLLKVALKSMIMLRLNTRCAISLMTHLFGKRPEHGPRHSSAVLPEPLKRFSTTYFRPEIRVL